MIIRDAQKTLAVALTFTAFIPLPAAWWWPLEAFAAYTTINTLARTLEASILRQERDEARQELAELTAVNSGQPNQPSTKGHP